ncbi:MAG: hypothetical protein D6776_09330 [Planctomycetota bacterium]|nr:MAG: hypothetical protein D6776_09330 [Planctomycetota bacterium]
MKTTARRLVRLVVGLVLIAVGLVLSLPGVPGPGLLVAAMGFSMLLSVSPRLRRGWVSFTRRHPRWFGWLRRWRVRLRRRRRQRNSDGPVEGAA